MLKKPETPPIDLSAKRGTIPKSSEVAAPAAQTPSVVTRPVETRPVETSATKTCATPCEDDVRIGAYYRWDAAGRPEGDGLHFWLEAEQEIMAGGAAKSQGCVQKQ